MIEGKQLSKIVLTTSRKKDDWESIYKNKTTPWDANEPEPYLVKLVEKEIVEPCLALDLGCGTGNEVIFLTKNGFSATGVDISATAIDEARKKAKAKKANCDFIVSDVLEIPLIKKYNFVLDRACFHFLNPEDRYRYIENLKAILNPSGLFLLVVSSDKETAKGPYQFSKKDIEELFSGDFEVKSIDLAILETHGEKPKPYICLMRKK